MAWSGVLEAKASALAATQHGVVTRAQLIELGISTRTISRRVAAKLWSWVFPGVLKLLPPPKEPWLQKLKAALLWLGDEHAAVSHRAAAKLWKFDGIEEEEVEVSTTSARNGRKVFGVVIHRVREFARGETTVVDGFRVTSAARTLQDLAPSVAEDRLDAAMDSVVRAGHAGVKALKSAMRRHFAGRRCYRRLLDALSDAGPRDSEAERLFDRNVIEAHGLPKPLRNVALYDAEGKFVARPDAVYEDLKIVIEIYSRKHHGSNAKIEHDSARQNGVTTCGYYPLIFWWNDIRKNPTATAERIAAVRAQRYAELMG